MNEIKLRYVLKNTETGAISYYFATAMQMLDTHIWYHFDEELNQVIDVDRWTGLYDGTGWEELNEKDKKFFFNHVKHLSKENYNKYNDVEEVKDFWQGREIYENDIVDLDGGRCQIKCDTYKCYAKNFFDASQDEPNDIFSEYAHKQGKIVGNVYDNPELL